MFSEKTRNNTAATQFWNSLYYWHPKPCVAACWKKWQTGSSSDSNCAVTQHRFPLTMCDNASTVSKTPNTQNSNPTIKPSGSLHLKNDKFNTEMLSKTQLQVQCTVYPKYQIPLLLTLCMKYQQNIFSSWEDCEKTKCISIVHKIT